MEDTKKRAQLAWSIILDDAGNRAMMEQFPAIPAYQTLLEAENTKLKGEVAYLTGKVEQFEKALSITENEEPYLEPRLSVVRPKAMSHLGDAYPLWSHPHRERQVPLMDIRHGGIEGATPPGEDDALLLRKDLTEPLVPDAPAPVEVDREPKSLLDATGMDGGELFCGADGHESGGRHDGHLSLNSLTELIERVSVQCVEEIFKDAADTKRELPGGDFGALIAVRKSWKHEALVHYRHKLLAALRQT